MRRWVECVPNFSEGRNPEKVRRMAGAVAAVKGVLLLDETMDRDHNRSVLTFVGEPEDVAKAAIDAAKVAAGEIDLRSHRGAHPRIGAVDVVPFVPFQEVSVDECVALARRVAARLWETLALPVYFYGEAALTESRQRLENIRRGGFEGLLKCLPADLERRPDVGGPELHPTAGACAVGARKFLIAYNIELATTHVSIAKQIARHIRESSGGLRSVKALGLELPSRNLTQVSMNLTDYECTSPHVVFERVAKLARSLGVEIAGTELVGLIPRAALNGAPKEFIASFRPDQILENRIESRLAAARK